MDADMADRSASFSRVAADANGRTLTSLSKVINCAYCVCLMNVDFQFRFWNQLALLA